MLALYRSFLAHSGLFRDAFRVNSIEKNNLYMSLDTFQSAVF